MKRKAGISPVVATVILVAVAIVIAIAVAFWASGLVGIFTRFERVEIVSVVQTGDDTFQVILRNTGSADTSIIQTVVNGRAIGTLPSPFALAPGATGTCTITVNPDPTPGVTVEIIIYSSGGKQYPTAVLATRGTGTGAWTVTSATIQCS
ncbi:MAG: archaellin/type IV pilin N-terminal domain-containing protein [Candidatus Caldarchaeum sp.]